uniref:Uncharacterized protein n=1 Tax=Anopheles atroparvus TaxID=41427 RepID=A0AAG5DIZ6_ANOAO
MIDFVGAIFAILVAVGGIMGYVRARSRMSLYSGILFGVALGVGAWLNSMSDPLPIVQLAVLAVLIMVMLYRYWSTRAFMPAGMIILLSFGVVVWTCVVYRDYLSMGWMRGVTNHDRNLTVIIVDENSKLE